LTRHLLVAAALREALAHDPIVVGGTAEEYWTSGEYHETDLDVCVPLSQSDRETLISLGFERDGRHWYHPRAQVAVEFPDSKIDGDERRVIEVPIGSGRARIIGVDDLYVDRLTQATMSEGSEGIEFESALAVAAANLDVIDWTYVQGRIQEALLSDLPLGQIMKRLDSKIRRRARRLLSRPSGKEPSSSA
jgi:hypothetical protein